VKLPSFTGRSETAPVRDENADGRVDERDAAIADRRADNEPATGSRDSRPAGGPRGRIAAAFGSARATNSRPATGPGSAPVVTPDRADETTTYRSSTATDDTAPTKTTERVTTTEPVTRPEPVTTADRTGTADRTATADRAVDVDRTADSRPAVDGEPTVVAAPPGPRPRASLLATLGLIVAVAAALFALSGTLAGYGIGLGALAILLSIGGISATAKRHVAGKSDALIGLLLGLGAVVVGVLAMTGQFSWPSTDGGTVEQFRQWLDSQFVDRFQG
jgi:hypothetical protein